MNIVSIFRSTYGHILLISSVIAGKATTIVRSYIHDYNMIFFNILIAYNARKCCKIIHGFGIILFRILLRSYLSLARKCL